MEEKENSVELLEEKAKINKYRARRNRVSFDLLSSCYKHNLLTHVIIQVSQHFALKSYLAYCSFCILTKLSKYASIV